MKQIISLVLFLMAGTTASAQILKTAGIPYTASSPSHTPSASGSLWALDTANLDLYAYYGGSWKLAGERIQSISGCTGPAYVPGKGQALFVINACDSLYYYRSSAWRHINKGSGGVGADTSGYNLSFTRVADTLYMTDGAGTLSVVLPSGSVDTDDQTLSIDSAAIADGERFALSISDGNTVYFEDTDTQNISISNDTISLERGGFVVLPSSVATDTSGYNTALTYSGDTLTLTDGNGALSVSIPGADGNGIYSGDGMIAANTTATLTSTRAFWIDYSNDVPAIQISDATGTGNGVTISNRNNNGELIINNTQIEARAPNLLISGTGGGPGVLRIKETIGGSDYTQFTTGAQSGNILYTLPTATGQNGEVLKWTTGGQLVWDSIITTDAQTLSIDSTITGGVERFSVAISNGNAVSFDVPQGVFLTDGDKNDIDVSGDGATWTIDTSAVTSIKIAADAIDSTKIAAGGISVTDIGQHSASSGQVLKWNGAQWAPANDATGSAGTGEANVGANLGAGIGVYEGKVDTILRFKSLTEGYGLDLTGSATEINIKADTAQLATVNDINIVQADIDAHEAADGDLSVTNEGALDVAAGGANSSVITSNTSGSLAVTIAGGTGIAVSETADTITITNTLTLDGNGIYSGSGTIPPNTLASAPNGFKMHNNNAGTIQIGDTTTNGARLETSYNYVGFNSDNYTWGMYIDRENVNMVINSPQNDIEFGNTNAIVQIGSGSTGFSIQDARTNKRGLVYADDYSDTLAFYNRSIPDVGTVKSLISDSLATVSGVSDGDKGDIDVTASGATWTVDTSAITTIKIAANAVDSTKIGAGAISITDIGQHGAASGEVLKWNGTQWAPATDNTGGGGSIDSTTARNTGASGEGLYSHEAFNVLNFKKLIAGANITLTPADSSITIAATGGGASDGNGIYSSDDTITVNRTVTVDEDSTAQFSFIAKDDPNSYLSFNPTFGTGIQKGNHGLFIFEGTGFGGATMFSNFGTTQIKLHNDSIQIKANGDDGAAGQVLKSNGSFVYWDDDATGGGSPSVITPSQITSDQDNYSPTNWATATVVRISGDNGIRAITGFASAGIADGHEKKLINVGSYPVYIPGEHPDSQDSNRVNVGYDYMIYPKATAWLLYDNTLNRWVVTSESAYTLKTLEYSFSPGSTTAADYGYVTFGTLGSGAVGTAAPVDNIYPGALTLTDGSAVSSGSFIGFPKTVAAVSTYGDAHIVLEGYVSLNSLSTASDTFYAGIQLTQTVNTNGVFNNNSISIIYSHIYNSGNWSLVAYDNAGSASSFVDLGVAAAEDGPVLLRLELDKNLGEARAYINGAYAGRVATNMPITSANLTGRAVLRNAATGASLSSLRVHALNHKIIFD